MAKAIDNNKAGKMSAPSPKADLLGGLKNNK